MKISQNIFRGAKPGVEPGLIGLNEAQVADNCNLDKGGLRPYKAPSDVQLLTLDPVKSIFQYSENNNVHWVESANDIDAVKNPIVNDAYERMFFTGESEPRFFANDIVSIGGFDSATDFLKLGIPAPSAAPSVVRVDGAGAIYRAYVYTYLNNYGDEGSNSPIGEISDFSSGRMKLQSIQAAPSARGIDRIWVYRINVADSDVAAFQFCLEAMFFDTAAAYIQGDFVVYSGSVWECTDAGGHTGAWNAAHFTEGEAQADSALGEVISSVNYTTPPAALSGLIEIAGGALCGFYGNTVYPGEPGHPHAFPTAYRKSFPHDVVALAVSGTNIWVLTSGRPYLLYGQHPGSLAKIAFADLLPCEAKRTVGVWNNAVYFRSRDGVVRSDTSSAMLITTEISGQSSIIDSQAWRSSYLPVHSRFYNNLYFAFTATRTYVIDFYNRTIRTLNLVVQASQVSDIDSKLYLAIKTGPSVYIKEWEGDSQNYLPYTWRSRLYVPDALVNFSHALVILEKAFLESVASLIDIAALNAALFAAGDIDGALRLTVLREKTLRRDDLYSLNGFSISANVSFKLYADGQLRHSETFGAVENTFAMPADYISRQIEYELTGYVPVIKCQIVEAPEELES